MLPATAGWIIAGIVSCLYVGGTLWSALSGVRHGIKVRDPIVLRLVRNLARSLPTAERDSAQAMIVCCDRLKDKHGAIAQVIESYRKRSLNPATTSA